MNNQKLQKRVYKTKINFSKEQNLELIKNVMKHDVLYNISHKDFKKRKIKDKIWLEIANYLGKPVQEVKERYRRMKDYAIKKSKKNLMDFKQISSDDTDGSDNPENNIMQEAGNNSSVFPQSYQTQCGLYDETNLMPYDLISDYDVEEANAALIELFQSNDYETYVIDRITKNRKLQKKKNQCLHIKAKQLKKKAVLNQNHILNGKKVNQSLFDSYKERIKRLPVNLKIYCEREIKIVCDTIISEYENLKKKF